MYKQVVMLESMNVIQLQQVSEQLL